MTSRRTFKIGIQKYNEHMHEIFEMYKFIPPPSSNNEEYQDAA